MKILFDCICLQYGINGGAEYAKRIIQEAGRTESLEVIIYLSKKRCLLKEYDMILSDMSLKRYYIEDIALKAIVDKENVDKIFFPLLQCHRYVNLEDIEIPCIGVLHDLRSLEMAFSNIYSFLSIRDYIKQRVFFRKYEYYLKRKIENEIGNVKFWCKESNTVITVSNYSSTVIRFFIPEIKPLVYYSPIRETTHFSDCVHDDMLRKVIDNGMKYFFLVSADRREKNADVVFKAFERLVKDNTTDFYLLTTGTKTKYTYNHIPLDYLSESDLYFAYKNSFAFIYPSLQEGFGYPPVEAMKLGIPVIASNVTSIPEILEDAPLYFSPIYPIDLYGKMIDMIANREEYSLRSSEQYKNIKKKQDKHLLELIDLIRQPVR